MRSESVARSKQKRRASECTKVDLIRGFHSAAGTRSIQPTPYVLGRCHQIGEILISVNRAGSEPHHPALHHI